MITIYSGETDYELLLQTDLYTKRHTQWFYFRVQNTRPNCTYKFQIVNLLKPDSLYNYGQWISLCSSSTDMCLVYNKHVLISNTPSVVVPTNHDDIVTWSFILPNVLLIFRTDRKTGDSRVIRYIMCEICVATSTLLESVVTVAQEME